MNCSNRVKQMLVLMMLPLMGLLASCDKNSNTEKKGRDYCSYRT